MPYDLGPGYGQSAPTPSGIEHGQDIRTPFGTQFYAPAGGVVHVHRDKTLGLYLTLTSGGQTYFFGHLAGAYVKDGQKVAQGFRLGATGGPKDGVINPSVWGDATGPHLWFAVQQNGQFVNPIDSLNQNVLFGAGTGNVKPQAYTAQPGISAENPEVPHPAFLPPEQIGFGDSSQDVARAVARVLGMTPYHQNNLVSTIDLARQRIGLDVKEAKEEVGG